jgi:hypothetical protein
VSMAETILAVMKSRMSSTSLKEYTQVQSVRLRAASSSPRVIALKFRLLSETSFLHGRWPPALIVVKTGLWSVVALGITFYSETSPLVYTWSSLAYL